METSISKGLLAGFIATVVLSVLMALKAAMGLMPDVNAIRMLTAMAHGIMGTPPVPIVGWLLHFLIGTVAWGILFAALIKQLPGKSATVKGLVFGSAAWLLMMVVIMPMAGAGLFGLHLGLGAPIATLVLHWVFGAVLGVVYGRLGAARLATADTHA